MSSMFVSQINNWIKLTAAALGIALFSSMPVGMLLRASTLDVAFASPVTAAKLIELTNRAREANGLQALATSGLLTQSAQGKSNDMLAKNYFAHTSPEGLTPWYWFKEVGYNYIYAGENLAKNYATAESLFDAWMASPTHRANILSVNFREIGIAVASNESAIYATQHFGTQKAGTAGAVAAPRSTSAPAVRIATAAPAPAPVDVTAPEIVKEFLPAASIMQGDVVKFSLAVNGDPTAVIAKVGAKTVPLALQNGLWVGQVALYAGGEYAIYIEAKDAAGNVATEHFGSTNVLVPEVSRHNPNTRTMVAAYWRDVAANEAAPISLALIMIALAAGAAWTYAYEARRLADMLTKMVVLPMLRA